MNWRALLQNQWFQLCLLVAAVSGGVTTYNLAEKASLSNSDHNVTGDATPAPGPSASPGIPHRAITAIKPKRRGQWIVDSSGARDADSSDIETVAASLSDGDVVNIRAGTYTGNCEIGVSARFVGPVPGKGTAVLRATDAQRNGITISGKKVSLENLSIHFEAAGDSAAVIIWRDAGVEITNCAITTQSKFDVFVSESASLRASNTEFRAANAGCCLKFDGTAQGTVANCSFLAGRWGLEAITGAQVQGSHCTFRQIGLINGVGVTIGVVGGRAALTLDSCQFDANAASILADEGGTLHLTSSTFRHNGVTGEEQNSSSGMICASHGAQVLLKDDVFEENRQGLVANGGSTLTLENIRMERTGLVTNNQKLQGYGHAVGAVEQGTTVNVSGSAFSDSINNAFDIGGGASLKVLETTVANTTGIGLDLGFANGVAAQATLTKVRFLGAHADAVWVNSGSQLEMQTCVVTGSDATGVEAQDNGTQVKITDSAITACKIMGLNANIGATVSAFGCTMEATTRGAQAGLPNEPQKRGTVFLTNCTVRNNSIFGVGACSGATLVMKGGYLGANQQNTWSERGGSVRLER